MNSVISLKHNECSMLKYRERWVEWLSSWNNRYYLTITFNRVISNKEYFRSIDHLLRVLNSKLYGRRYRRDKKCIEGMVVRECNSQEDPHFHFLFRDENNDLELRMSFKEALDKALPKVRDMRYQRVLINSVELREGKDPLRLISDQGVDFQEYYNFGGDKLEKYVTKILKVYAMTKDERTDSLSMLDMNGANFGDYPITAYRR